MSQTKNKNIKSSDTKNDIDYDSFIDLHEQEESVKTGVARLKTVDEIDKYEKLPDEIKNQINSNYIDSYLEFSAEITSQDHHKDIKIYMKKSEQNIDILKDWSDTEYIKDLTLKEVPIKHIKNNIYTIPAFEKFRYANIDVSCLSDLYNNGYIEYNIRNKEWVVSDLNIWRRFKFSLSKSTFIWLFIILYITAAAAIIGNLFYYISVVLAMSTIILYIKMKLDSIPRCNLQDVR